MALPWEKYQQQQPAPQQAPWEKYAQPPVPQEPTLPQRDAEHQGTTEDRSFWDRPALATESITDQEVEQIAQKHRVDPKVLREFMPLLGGKPEDPSFQDYRRGLVYSMSQVGLGGFQKLMKMSQSPEMESAMDDLQDLGRQKASYLQLGAEIAAPAASLGLGVKGAAATGAVAGASGAPAGQELEGAAVGAALGGVIGKVAQKLTGDASKLEKQNTAEYVQRNSAEIDRGTDQILNSRRQSESDLESLILSRSEPQIDQPTAARIVSQQLDEQEAAKFLDASSEEGHLLRERLLRNKPDMVRDLGMERATEIQLAEDITERRARDFAEDLLQERPKNLQDAREKIAEYAARQGPEATAQRYKTFAEEQAAMDFITRNAVRAGRGDNFQDRALNFMSDAQFVLRDIDEQFGTKLEPVHQALNTKNNRMSFARNEFREELNKIFQANRKIDDQLIQGGRVYQALDTGDIAGLSKEELQAYNQFKSYFQQGLDYVNSLVKQRDPSINPMSIPVRENYVPHMLTTPEELAQGFEKRITQVLQDATRIYGKPVSDISQLSPKQFRELSSEGPLREVVEGLRVLDNREIRSGAELSARYKDLLLSRDGRVKMETMARAALERQGAIPEWMREKNLYKLGDRWATNTLKHMYLRKEMDQLRSIARRLEKAGGDLEAGYVQRLLQDINGVRKGTMAERTATGRTQYLTAVDKSGLPKPIAAVAKALPDILSDMNKQVYPNLLGLNPKSLLLNSTQLFTKTAPELGTKYGYGTIARGTVHALLNLNKQLARVREMGFVPAEFVAKYRRPVADGIRRSSLYSIPSDVVNKMGEAAMYLYTRMDSLNRAISLSVADMMASDLAGGSNLARESLAKFPTTVRRAVAGAKSPQEISSILATHLNASTQYNYNRASMSEWGRTMGPLFSVFSKWPTATAGEIVQEFRDKGKLRGTLRNAEKFVVPLMLLQLGDMLLLGEGTEDEKSDRLSKIVGKYGLSSAAPIGSIKSLATGDFFTPPAIDAVMQGVVVPSLNGDPDKLMRGLDSALYNFTPGSVYVKLLTDDLVTYLSGERPEGSTFVERTLEGARRLGRN